MAARFFEPNRELPSATALRGLISGGCAGVATALFTLVPDGQAAAAAAIFVLGAAGVAILPTLSGRLG